LLVRTNAPCPNDCSLEERFDIVIRCDSLSLEQMNTACRELGIYPHHLKQWKNNFLIGPAPKMTEEERAERKTLKQENDALRRELRRKEKALAEVAALLILQKKSENLGARRGRLTVIALRDEKIQDIKDAHVQVHVNQKHAKHLALAQRRWSDESGGHDGRLDTGREPHNKSLQNWKDSVLLAQFAKVNMQRHLPQSSFLHLQTKAFTLAPSRRYIVY
jgi:transposase-like protein